jgi:hypothetical protein
MRTTRLIRLVVTCAAAIAAIPVNAQTRPGPLPPPANAPPTVNLSPTPTATPPPVPVVEIVKRFSENEDASLRAHTNYGYHRTVKVEELDGTGKSTGEFTYATDWVRGPEGKFYEKPPRHPDSSLVHLDLEPENLEILGKIPPLPFTTAQLSHYNLTYAGTQKLDELNTYIFRVEPKQVERTKAYFQGVIWVDDQDFVIVKTTGRWLTELGDVATVQFPFKILDIYRENVEGKIWFPGYLRSEDSVPTKNGPIRVRLTVRWEKYKPETAPPSASQE